MGDLIRSDPICDETLTSIYPLHSDTLSANFFRKCQEVHLLRQRMQMTAYTTYYCDPGVDRVVDPETDGESSDTHLSWGLLRLEVIQ